MLYIVKNLNFMKTLPSVQNLVCHLWWSGAFTEMEVPELEKDSNYVVDRLEKKIEQYQNRTLVKSAYRKFNLLISQPKNMLWVLKRTVSMRRFF